MSSMRQPVDPRSDLARSRRGATVAAVLGAMLAVLPARGAGIAGDDGSSAGPGQVTPAVSAEMPCRIDFGVTADDFGTTSGCSTLASLTTQFVGSQSIVFGTATGFPGGPAPGVEMRSDGAFTPPCRSAGKPTFTTDWWCGFRLGTGPGVPGPAKGVDAFSAEIGWIDDPSSPAPLMIAYDAAGAVLDAATANPAGGGVQVLTVADPTRSKGIFFVQVDASADLAGLSVDCLDYDEPGDVPMPDVSGSNHHILTNGTDVVYQGFGAGGAQTALDGLGTFVAGEDLKGSHLSPLTGDFAYLLRGWRETVYLAHAGPGGPALRFPFIGFFEMDGLNGNAPAIFTNPYCSQPSFPVGTSGFVPYGVGPGSSVSFVSLVLPSSAGLPTSMGMIAPNNGLLPSAAGGSIRLAAGVSDVQLPVASTGFMWGVQFEFVPSIVPLADDIDGLWHWASNSPDGSQYWGLSNDELNLWQSWTVGSDAGGTTLLALTANVDYSLLLLSAQPVTAAALAPTGANQQGPYLHQTENVVTETGGPALNLNGGFDVGRGSRVISLSGQAGVMNPFTGLGNQNPAGSGKLPTLGFMTWDNGGDLNGSVRLVWISVDFLGLAGIDPASDPGVLVGPAGPRLPVGNGGFLQSITSVGFSLFGHRTSVAPSGWPDSDFGVSIGSATTAIAGASNQFPTTGLSVCSALLGLPVNLTYGSSGRLDGPGGITWDPNVADISGSRELFLLD